MCNGHARLACDRAAAPMTLGKASEAPMTALGLCRWTWHRVIVHSEVLQNEQNRTRLGDTPQRAHAGVMSLVPLWQL